jgi:DNA mismatch repair protein MutS2
MIAHTLEVLEYRETLAVVARYAASTPGAAAVRRLSPTLGLEQARESLLTVGEAMRLLGREGWVMPRFPDISDAIPALYVEGSSWEGPVLRSASQVIAAARSLGRTIAPLEEAYPRLAGLANVLAELPGIPEQIDRAVAEDGSIRDGASPELSRLRRGISGARGRIVGRLTEFAASLPAHLQVPDASVSVRDGRYVVPVRREGRSEVGGIIHGESQTGATLFIEPPLAVEMMNRLRELEAAESREVHRILRSLTALLRPHAGELQANLASLVVFDTIHARARYASSVDAAVPLVSAPGTEPLRIVQGRHPLLLAKGDRVVPFDLDMSVSERTLIISGPNTGGKTVLLKALGLLSLLARSGVVPPVGEGTRLILFDQVFADIGDEQSIEASLSTFSAHLRNLRETLGAADAGALVLIDEIGSGTDPVEGAALARAILGELTNRGSLTVATTHLGSLKLMATEDARVVNASLQFDADLLEPTYRLLKGVPGRSYGLAIARRLGLPEGVLRTAEEALPEGERDIGRLLLELEAKEQRVTIQEAYLAAERQQTAELLETLERREAELRTREKDAERRSRQQARDLLMQSRAEVEAAIQEVRGAAADEAALAETARAARRRIEEAARRQKERVPDEVTGPRVRAVPGALVIGARVRIESLKRTGTLLDVRDERAVVDTDGLRIQVPIDDVSVLPPGDQPGESGGRPNRKAGRNHVDFEASVELDLRGLRADDVELRLLRAIDNALMAGLPSFRIIHGKGTGALRAEVETLLKRDPRITRFRPGDRFEGGTGVTVAEFDG